MRSRNRHTARALFLGYLGLMTIAALMAVPLSRSLVPIALAQQQAQQESASAGASGSPGAAAAIRAPSFEECDRNGDGRLDKSESGAVPGLSAFFERVDTNKDGKLDREEFERALAFLESHRK